MRPSIFILHVRVQYIWRLWQKSGWQNLPNLHSAHSTTAVSTGRPKLQAAPGHIYPPVHCPTGQGVPDGYFALGNHGILTLNLSVRKEQEPRYHAELELYEVLWGEWHRWSLFNSSNRQWWSPSPINISLSTWVNSLYASSFHLANNFITMCSNQSVIATPMPCPFSSHSCSALFSRGKVQRLVCSLGLWRHLCALTR